MLLFVLKKSFINLYNNLEKVMFFNLGFVLAVIPLVFSFYLLQYGLIPFVAGVIAGVLIFGIYWAVISVLVTDMSDNKQVSIKDFVPAFKRIWKLAILVSLAIFVLIIVAFLNIRYYYSMKNYFGYVVMFVMILGLVVVALAMQYFYPVYMRFGGPIRSVLKKTFLITVDNPGFTIYLFFISVLVLVASASIGVGLLLIGFTGILLLASVGLKLRLYKYDYIEKDPQAARVLIPWNTILKEEKDIIGKVTFKSLVFPWRK